MLVQTMVFRNYVQKKGKELLSDPTMMKGWQDVFNTKDKEVVEAELRSTAGAEFSWKKDDSLRIVNKGKAIEPHPVTGDKIWFNHCQVRLCVCKREGGRERGGRCRG